MDTERYDVVFHGEIDQAHTLEEVQHNLAALFKLTQNQLEQVFTTRPYVVKSGIDYQTALKYKAAFERAGALCQIVAVSQGATPSETILPPEPPASAEQKTMVCPKCGAEQAEALRCSQCGIFIKTYLKKQEREARQQEYESEYGYERTREAETFTEPSPAGQFFAKLGLRIVAIMIIAAIAGGIGYFSTREEVVKSPAGTFRLTKPRGWRVDNELHDEADIQISNESQEGYFIVISEYKSDFESYMTYEGHSEITREFIKEVLINYREENGPTPVNINGMRGVQYEITGSVEGLRIKYLHTTLESRQYFHQMIAWSLPSKYDKNRPVFEKILQSFYELY